VALGALTLACGRSTSFDVTLKEPNVYQVLQSALDIAQIGLPVELSGIDIRDGYMRASGSYTDGDGATTSGTVDLGLSTQDGAIEAELIRIDIPGVDLTAEQIAGYNDILTQQFNKAATSLPGVKVESVDVVEDAIKLRVRLGLGR
jgi:hypothetical protein